MKSHRKNTKSTKKTLSQMVLNILDTHSCSIHSQKFVCYNRNNQKLGCQQCLKQWHEEQIIELEQLLQNPILLMIHNNNDSKSQFYNYFKNIQSIQTIKSGFHTLINSLKQKLITSCEQIEQYFQQKYENIQKQTIKQAQYIKQVQIQYRQQFQILISSGFNNGTQQQLQMILKQFIINNQNPSQILNTKIHQIYTNVRRIPIINWQYLQKLYVQVTDPCIWQSSSIFKQRQNHHHNQESIYSHDNNNNKQQLSSSNKLTNLQIYFTNQLQDRQYQLYYDENIMRLFQKCKKQLINVNANVNNKQWNAINNNRIVNSNNDQQNIADDDSLDFGNKQNIYSNNHHHDHQFQQQYKQQNNTKHKIVAQIQTQHDYYYQLDKYRILGVKYNCLTMYSYSFNNLIKIKQYQITGCTQILNFSQCLIIIANYRLIRLWLNDGNQDILGLGFEEIKYLPNKNNLATNLDVFICVNSNNQKYLKSVRHNSIDIALPSN